MSKALLLLAAMLLGALVPALHAAAPAMPWLVALMLFLAFSGVRFGRGTLRWAHLRLLAALLAIGGGGCALLWGVDRDLALAALLIGIAPTATSAAVVMRSLGGDGGFVAVAALLSNLAVLVVAPAAIRLLLGSAAPVPLGAMLLRVALVVALPLAAAQLLRTVRPAAADALQRFQAWAFGLWLVALVIVAADASRFIRASGDVPPGRIAAQAGLALAVCVLSFAAGRWLGWPDRRREASQSLGQKNTVLTIWMASTFANPVVALAPTFYVLWHNLINALQLVRRSLPAGPEDD